MTITQSVTDYDILDKLLEIKTSADLNTLIAECAADSKPLSWFAKYILRRSEVSPSHTLIQALHQRVQPLSNNDSALQTLSKKIGDLICHLEGFQKSTSLSEEDRRTVASMNEILHNSQTPQTHIREYLPDYSDYPERYHPTVRMLMSNSKKFFGTQQLCDFFEVVVKKHSSNNNLLVLAKGLVNKHIIEEREPSAQFTNQSKHTIDKAELIFIPFVYLGSRVLNWIGLDTGHIVVITIDRANQTIEYYDPLAYRPEEWKCYPGFSMKEDLEKLYKLNFPESGSVNIIVNEKEQQKDWHSCGTFCMLHMLGRVQGETFASLTAQEIYPELLPAKKMELAALFKKKEGHKENSEGEGEPLSCEWDSSFELSEGEE